MAQVESNMFMEFACCPGAETFFLSTLVSPRSPKTCMTGDEFAA